MSDMLTNAGALGWMIIAGTLVGLLAAAGLGGLAFTKRRVPLTALMLFPYLTLAVGAFGAWASTASVSSAVASADPSQIANVAMSGIWGAMAVDWVARWAGALVLVAGAWAAAVGSFAVPGPEPKFTVVSSAGAAIAAAVGALGICIYAAVKDLSGGAYVLALIVLLGGLGVAVSAARRAVDDEMFRVAGMRFASSMCALFAIWHALRAVDIGNRVGAFAPTSELMSATDINKAIELYSAVIDPGVIVGVAALMVGLVIAFFGFFAEIGEVVVRYTVFDVFGTVALMVMVGVLRTLENIGFNSIYVVATNTPAVEEYHELTSTLPASVVTLNDAGIVVRMVEGGFGDVLEWDGDTWVRRFEWSGRNWWEDRTPIAEVRKLADRPPLLAAERAVEAEKILEVLEKTSTGEAYLLMRASEAKAGTFIPPELGRLQTTFLPVKLSKDRDLKTQLWIAAGSPEANWGPTTWFGEKDDSLDPVEYANAALAATSSPGLHVLAAQRKVGDIVTTCMPYLIDRVGEAPQPGVEGGPPPSFTMNAGRWCALSADEYDVVRKEAAALWEIPNPENVRMTVNVEGGLDQAEVDDYVRRELGGIAYCAKKLTDAGTELKGRMTLVLAVSKEGQVYDTLVDEKSKLQEPAIKTCAAKRFRKLSFTLPDPSEAPPAPVEPPRRGRGRNQEPPAPVVPKAIIDLDF